MNNHLTLGSLFDGSGGFPLGGLLCGIEPIWASEIEPFPIRVTSKRIPQMKHLGDISKLHGDLIEPVDIITFGSPCQDMSIAGKRSGLDGSRSSLFYEAIRIVKEMRRKTNGRKPRYIVWENVPGAFSSNNGDDFKTVLEEICKVKRTDMSIPKSNKWQYAGKIVGDDFSLAWRTLDAQFWGVPQRRRRIYLVADFNGKGADKILFESEGMSRYSSSCRTSWQTTADCSQKGITATGFYGYNSTLVDDKASTLGVNCGYTTGRNGVMALNDQGGERMDLSEGKINTLRASSNHPPLVFENHSQDTRFKQLHDIAPTVLSTYGTGGNNQPFVCFDVRLTSENTKNARANIYETDVARTIDTGGAEPSRNQGGVAVVCVDQGGGEAACNIYENKHLTHRSGHVVSMTTGSFMQVKCEQSPNLAARDFKDPPVVCFNEQSFSGYDCAEVSSTLKASGGNYGGGSEMLNVTDEYIVRRLTPTECARLQGFPDWWCDNLGYEKPTDDEIQKWREIFLTHAKITGKPVKPKTRNQIIKWLKNPYSDSAAYKMWGNGVALPNVFFVLAGIEYYSNEE